MKERGTCRLPLMNICREAFILEIIPPSGSRGSHRDDRKSRQGPSRSGPGRPAGRAANDDRRSTKSKHDDKRNASMDSKSKKDGKVFRMDQVHLSNPGSVQVS